MDKFDTIRAALYQNKSPILTGAVWRSNWHSSDGIIPIEEGQGSFGHAFTILGYIQIDGKPFLKIQNSYGKSWGKDGFNYFPREVVNRDFTFGNFQFIDMPRETAEFLNAHKLSTRWTWLAKLAAGIKNYFLVFFS